jgi:pilus assembly protein CpaE
MSLVFSPRGGAGATTIATNLAVGLAHRAPDRVVLVDLNMLWGHVPLLLNLRPRTSLAAISPVSLREMDRESFESYLTTHAESSLRVLAGVLRPEDGELVHADQVRAALELLRRSFSHVVVDLGRGFSDVNLTAIELADVVLMLCTSERVGVRAVQESRRIFRDVLGLPAGRLRYVLNNPSPYATYSTDELEQALETRLANAIPFGGDAPSRAALEGAPLVTRAPGSAVSKAIVGIAAQLEEHAREAVALAT